MLITHYANIRYIIRNIILHIIWLTIIDDWQIYIQNYVCKQAVNKEYQTYCCYNALTADYTVYLNGATLGFISHKQLF